MVRITIHYLTLKQTTKEELKKITIKIINQKKIKKKNWKMFQMWKIWSLLQKLLDQIQNK